MKLQSIKIEVLTNTQCLLSKFGSTTFWSLIIILSKQTFHYKEMPKSTNHLGRKFATGCRGFYGPYGVRPSLQGLLEFSLLNCFVNNNMVAKNILNRHMPVFNLALSQRGPFGPTSFEIGGHLNKLGAQAK